MGATFWLLCLCGVSGFGSAWFFTTTLLTRYHIVPIYLPTYLPTSIYINQRTGATARWFGEVCALLCSRCCGRSFGFSSPLCLASLLGTRWLVNLSKLLMIMAVQAKEGWIGISGVRTVEMVRLTTDFFCTLGLDTATLLHYLL